MKPSVGRIVHYGWCERTVPPTGPAVEKFGPLKAVAAIIIDVIALPAADPYHQFESSYTVKLQVFLPNKEALYDDGKPISYSDTLESGKWTWPPRE